MLVILLVGWGFQAQAQYEDIGFLIVGASKQYNTALKITEDASQKLGFEVNLRGYYEDATLSLATDQVCGCGENHGYIPRGRFDHGEYISIEHTDYFEKFTDGWYIVVVDTGSPGLLKESLPAVKKHFPDACIKQEPVYAGCMH